MSSRLRNCFLCLLYGGLNHVMFLFLLCELYLIYASVPLGFFSVADAFPMEIDKHQAMFGRYNRTFGE